ncbi:MAG: RecQ family ATP-dependent DNA helicase [Candidatus Solibacter usitatus]|nr:RecQ family ATP-dependent DNA helicase [Candidatus Solibacter usitatus]
MVDLHALLRQYWGYDAFRPKQENIIQSILNGHDVAAVMPTGAGKSLCYQFPAVVLDRTVVVISPLIALMRDQVAQLGEMGIRASALNSSIAMPDQRDVMQAARAGDLRLLYLSPERLARQDTIDWLRNVPKALFAIDEAHCISEWGHEFRPEYRELHKLRTAFPEVPLAAFTASATRRVRHDILSQLQLREPRTFISSFFRPNLRYWVEEVDQKTQEKQLLKAVDATDGEVIVYCSTTARVDQVEALLQSNGIPAAGYHGKMDADRRRRNQDSWMNGETRVMVGTIAFGMGINKASVRAVIHLSLPKSIEQYYQEAGRAGRDGEPADCVLLWQKRDTALLAHFIGEIQDEGEKQRAWQRYRAIRDFVAQGRCRHDTICRYFGETPKWQACGACDICGFTPEWKTRARKTETPHGVLHVPAPPAAPDQLLLAHLREWRRAEAKRAGMPAFVILHDKSLEDLCRKRPKTLRELRHVFGIGERKVETLGPSILAALKEFR